VIGAGNVAMDVARLLAIDPTELDLTDTAEHALPKFKQSKIRKVIICGRRGAEHAAFTAPELRDLPKLENTDVFIDKEEISQASDRVKERGEVEKDLSNNLEALRLIAEHDKKGVQDGNERGYEGVDDVPDRLQFPKYAKHAKHPQKPENEDRDFHISGTKQRNMPGGNYEEIKVVPAVFDEFVFPVCV
jgi:hypothetical protein